MAARILLKSLFPEFQAEVTFRGINEPVERCSLAHHHLFAEPAIFQSLPKLLFVDVGEQLSAFNMVGTLQASSCSRHRDSGPKTWSSFEFGSAR